jgi:L-threonylcarbamoyladenylate synthase
VTVFAPTPEGIAAAAATIRSGELVVYPTETVYGIGADPFNPVAVERLFAVKQRESGRPIILIIADPDDLREIAMEVSDATRTCVKTFWPGPLSLLVPKLPRVPDAITGGDAKVCVRCPSSEIARALCRNVGHVITSTSANRSGQAAARSLRDVESLGVDAAIDGGTLPDRLPSTVYDADLNRVIREGAVPPEALRAALGN